MEIDVKVRDKDGRLGVVLAKDTGLGEALVEFPVKGGVEKRWVKWYNLEMVGYD